MESKQQLARRFEGERARLRAMAYRMLGALGEAEDAVQEAWLRLGHADPDELRNLRGWLTTVTARICLDMLRTRQTRREDPLEGQASPDEEESRADPEQEALLADEVGLALLVVLGTLNPAERVAFVLHDVFDFSFADIAPIVGRSTDAVRQLASRGRRRIRQTPVDANTDLKAHRSTVDAYLSATRQRDLDALIAVLDPDVVLRVDAAILPPGMAGEVRGAANVARRALAFPQRATWAAPVLVNGTIGVLVAPRGLLFGVVTFVIRQGRIAEIDAIADKNRLDQLVLGTL